MPNVWLLPLSDLTPEQQRVVELPPDDHRLVLGPPGSGKTQVLIHRANYLQQKYKVSHDRYRVFVFTNVIKEYIRSGFEFLHLPDDAVSTFDYWCCDMYEKHISRRLPFQNNSRIVNFPKVRADVLNLLRSRSNLRFPLDFIMVDEGQDLAPDVYEIMRLISRHVTVFADPAQKIFEDGASEKFIVETLGIQKRYLSLLGDYRNAAYVAQLASHFIPDVQARSQFLMQIHTEQKVKEKPLLFIAPDFDSEIDRLAEIIKQRQLNNERIGIIVPTNRLLHGIAAGLEERETHVEKAVKVERGKKVDISCDFGNLIPKIATFYQAKGLTFDTVMLPRLGNRAFPRTFGEARQKMLFVGIARATQWVYLSTVQIDGFDEMQILGEAERDGHLTIQKAAQWQRAFPTAGQKVDKTKKKDEDDYSVL